ncbi:MAG: PQQ-binding-like beta-propeller repeat protein [Phycisphaerales bacterium]|nr:PQQ-binding-like beta-propeller repeat protein [Phycisphaerales bacterium]
MIIAAYFLTASPQVAAANDKYVPVDWPGWRGPTHNGVTTEKGWTTTWPGESPRKLWDKEIGKGFSTFAVVGGKAYTMGLDPAQKNQGLVYCLNAQTGEVLWTYPYATKSTGPYAGPRASPCVSDNVLYTITFEGRILALDATNARLLWDKDVPSKFKPTVQQYGLNGSPLVWGQWVIFDIGPMIALDKKTGELVWKSKDYPCGNASPVAFEWNGKTCITTLSHPGLVVVDAKDGSELAFASWSRSANACTPMPVDGNIFIECDFRAGTALLQLDPSYRDERIVQVIPGMETRLKYNTGPAPATAPAATAPATKNTEWTPTPAVEPIRGIRVLYENNHMTNQFHNAVVYNGHAYGQHQSTNGLRCLEVKTGKVVWDHPRLGKELPLIIADGKIIMFTGKQLDEILFAEAAPVGYKQLGKFEVGEVITQTAPKSDPIIACSPVLSGGRLFLRWSNGKAMCFDLRP